VYGFWLSSQENWDDEQFGTISAPDFNDSDEQFGTISAPDFNDSDE
jgi:hypothetical protein